MKNQKQCTILIAGNVYNIDFSILHQYRMNDASKYRRVKRDLSIRPKKGVGGIRQKFNPINETLILDLSRLNLIELNV